MSWQTYLKRYFDYVGSDLCHGNPSYSTKYPYGENVLAKMRDMILCDTDFAVKCNFQNLSMTILKSF